MNVVEEVRKAIEDLVTPELQALDAQVAGLGQTLTAFDGLTAQLDGLEQTMTARFDGLTARLDTLMATMEENHACIMSRLARTRQ
jgi:hypothetical protein